MRHSTPFLTTLAVATVVFAVSAANASAAGNAEHNRYKWKDAQGNLHFDDVLPPEAMQVGYDIVNVNGLTIKHVERLRTPEEIKADEAAATRAANDKRIADEQAKADQQTLAAYPTEADLVEGQKAQLAMLDQNIHATEISLQSQEKSLTELLSHAADLDRNGKPVPATLRSQIDTLRRNIEQQKTYIAGKGQEKVDAVKRFEGELQRYRRLREAVQTR